jgi:acyl-CoA reductase-like NAD-dependent aldehyde dehydrogenase
MRFIAATENMTDYAWVVEAAHATTPLYWDGGDWSGNHMRAVRFARKVDADRIMVNIPADMRRDDMRSAEHGWSVLAATE